MLNKSNCVLVCDYHIGEEEFKQALAATADDKKLSDEIEKAAAEKNAKDKAEVDDWADNVFSSITKKRESLILHNYSIYESYLALYRIKNEADGKQDSDNTKTEITPPNEDDNSQVNNTDLTEDDFALASNRFGKTGKILKTAFLYGPSKSVLQSGKQIYITIDGTADEDEIAANKAEKDNKNKNNNENLRKHNSYSIYESCLSLNKMKNEADDTSTNNQQEQTMKDTDEFTLGSVWVITVMLKDEGFSEWKVYISDKVPREKYNSIKSKLKSGNFAQAYEEASASTDSDGLVPMSCKTYINKEPICGIPWFGHCRYGFLSGGEDDDQEIANTLFLSILPFDAVSGGKPDAKSSDKSIVFKAAYNVVGDISDGKVGALVNFVKNRVSQATDRITGEYKHDDKDDTELNKYLKSRFKCIGDSSMYKQFRQIREYLEVELKTKDKNTKKPNLQIDINESTNIVKYAEKMRSKKALIFY